jgi:hypothetical protein
MNSSSYPNQYVARSPVRTSNAQQPVFETRSQTVSIKGGQNLAITDFSVRQYVESHQRARGIPPKLFKLDVVVLRAQNIQTSLAPLGNPFLEMYITGFKADHVFLEFERGNLTPYFATGISFALPDPKHSALTIELWDHDLIVPGEEPLGVAAVALPKLGLLENQPVDVWIPFERAGRGVVGQVQVRITAVDFRYGETVFRDLSRGSNVRDFPSIVQGNTSHCQNSIDSTYAPVFIEDMAIHAQTGDLLLFSGVRPQSKAIQLATASIWSHVAVIIRNPSPTVRALYNLPSNKSVFALESDFFTLDKRPGGGVQLIEIEKWFKLTYLHPDPNCFLCLRKINRMGQAWGESIIYEQTLLPFLQYAYMKPYETSPTELIAAVYNLNVQKESTTSSYFCSELVGDFFKVIGAIQPTVITNNITPQDLCPESQELMKIAIPGVSWDNTLYRVKAKVYQIVGEQEQQNGVVWKPMDNQLHARAQEPPPQSSVCTIL